jgi:hypothetical protein
MRAGLEKEKGFSMSRPLKVLTSCTKLFVALSSKVGMAVPKREADLHHSQKTALISSNKLLPALVWLAQNTQSDS